MTVLMITTRLFAAVLLAGSILPSICTSTQKPLSLTSDVVVDDDLDAYKPPRPRTLQGRFLHITDLHPDPFYVAGVSTKHACHRADSKAKKSKRSGAYGAPHSGCDSPFALVNGTIAYLAENWAEHIDFVVWTGDSARHDNDRRHPRTPKEIYSLNRMVVKQVREAFTSKGIPVIPSLGNNDIWPHNILAPGPNEITNEFSSIWRPFLPSAQYQVFQRGAYFTVEAIPGKIAVISLNTLYFYDSNKAVRGCEWGDIHDAGNLEFDWLDVQLGLFRDRGMYVYLTGHVPPSPGNYFPECYVRYTELALRFQDIILGHLYGHMNVDHFFFLEATELDLPAEASGAAKPRPNSHEDLYTVLLQDFAELPKRKSTDEANFVPVNVAASLVPNPYFPAFRVYTYNTTGASDPTIQGKDRKHGHRRGPKVDKKRCKDAPWKDRWRCHLTSKWHIDPDSPARKNKLWTPLGFTQYYFPDVVAHKAKKAPKFELEYTTFRTDALRPKNGTEDEVAGAGFIYPIPPSHLPRSLRPGGDAHGRTKRTPYAMRDLTVSSWLKLARTLGNTTEEKIRARFRTFMTVSAGGEVEG